ncbi:unnamed protein product [Cladocopium goreaui]|uniref:Uncharacterized protein n=1 Tax=Cladocopium goreaui TaxID=2562237 RepID=A0A9P1GM31_9DINO|nr:unnamed protein product [Cladocopium goreaui]
MAHKSNPYKKAQLQHVGEAHSTPAKEETQDEATIKVRDEGRAETQSLDGVFTGVSRGKVCRGHSFLVHVDEKVPALQSLEIWAESFDNIHVRSNISVKRSGASLLAAEIYGIVVTDVVKELDTLFCLQALTRWSVQLLQRLALTTSRCILLEETFNKAKVFNDCQVNRSSLALKHLERNCERNSTHQDVECDERVYSVRMAGHEVSRLQLKESQRYVIVRQDRCIQVACSET